MHMQYFLNIYCMSVFLYIHNKYAQYTHIYYVHSNFYSGCDWLWLIVAQHQYIVKERWVKHKYL